MVLLARPLRCRFYVRSVTALFKVRTFVVFIFVFLASCLHMFVDGAWMIGTSGDGHARC